MVRSSQWCAFPMIEPSHGGHCWTQSAQKPFQWSNLSNGGPDLPTRVTRVRKKDLSSSKTVNRKMISMARRRVWRSRRRQKSSAHQHQVFLCMRQWLLRLRQSLLHHWCHRVHRSRLQGFRSAIFRRDWLAVISAATKYPGVSIVSHTDSRLRRHCGMS